MTTAVQVDVLKELAKGAVLALRVSKRGLVGDFLLLRNGKTRMVVTRRTVAAICRLKRESAAAPLRLAATTYDSIQGSTDQRKSIAELKRRMRPLSQGGRLPLMVESISGMASEGEGTEARRSGQAETDPATAAGGLYKPQR